LRYLISRVALYLGFKPIVLSAARAWKPKKLLIIRAVEEK